MAERLSAVIADLLETRGPHVERDLRVALAVAEELRLLSARISATDPDMQALRAVRPLAEVEREAIEHAVATCGLRKHAAAALEISPAQLYRKLAQYKAQETRHVPIHTPLRRVAPRRCDPRDGRAPDPRAGDARTGWPEPPCGVPDAAGGGRG